MAITSLPNGWIFVPRADYKASRTITGPKQKRGTKKLHVHHSAFKPHADPCRAFRDVDNVLKSRGLKGYNFYVHPSGVVGEGSGMLQGEHTKNNNSTSMAICLLGNFDKEQPTLAALVNAARTINLLRLDGVLDPNVVILRHKDSVPTACPGANMSEPRLNGKSGTDWIREFVKTGV